MTSFAPPASSTVSVSTVRRPTLAARFRWTWRLARRGALLLWLSVAAYMAIEVLVFRHAYPTAASRQQLLELSTSTAVRVMQGVPGAIDTAGGFAIWDGGWMVMLIVACWAVLTAVRLTRGEEDAGRAELVLSRPLTPAEALTANLLATTVATVGLGFFGALPFVILGEPVEGALLWGVGLCLFATTAIGLGMLAAQVLAPRRRATSAALAVVAAAFLLRAVANSADSRSWLSAFTPFGWLDRLRVYGGNDWKWVLPPAILAVLLSGAAIVLRGRRDAGAALLRSEGSPSSSLRLLGGPARFGWRLSCGALLAWTITLAICGLVFGLMTQALVDFINKDDTYRKMLESMGMDVSAPAVGFVSYIAVFSALPFAAFVGWRVGAAWQEESAGRLNNLLVRGVERWRWLLTTSLAAIAAAAILVTATAVAVWVGVMWVGAPVGARQVLEPFVGTLPLAVLFTGIALLAYGVLPQLTIAAPVTIAVVSYVLYMVGGSLKWPGVVLGISPFQHLARLPGQPMTATAVAVMLTLGAASATIGIIAFSRRDVRGV